MGLRSLSWEMTEAGLARVRLALFFRQRGGPPRSGGQDQAWVSSANRLNLYRASLVAILAP